MNKTETKTLSEFPDGLDAIVNERFPGANCETTFSIFTMRHVTSWNEKMPKAKKQRVKDFVEGFMAGNEELANRLSGAKGGKAK